MTRTVRVSATIPGPIEGVFAFFDDPDAMLEFSHAAQRIERMDQLPDGRVRADITMVGRRGRPFTLRSEQVERDPPRRIVSVASAPGYAYRVVRDFATDGDGTRVTIEQTYRLTRPIVGWIAEWFQRDAVRMELEALLDAVAQRMAARPPSRA
jgi:uncharacterized protein YndB with AHSA1/START domain